MYFLEEWEWAHTQGEGGDAISHTGIWANFGIWQWSDINIVFQFCLLHEVVSYKWKMLRSRLSHSLNLSAWRLPSMQFWNKEASFWFLHSVTFFDWARLVGMEINTALCIWCSLIFSPHCLQVEAREVCLCVFVCVCRSMCTNKLPHNNSSSSWSTGKLLFWARQ